MRWLLQTGYAVGTVNLKLSTVKQYAKLAFQAQALSAEQHALIRTVTGFQFKEHKQVNEKRSAAETATRSEYVYLNTQNASLNSGDVKQYNIAVNWGT